MERRIGIIPDRCARPLFSPFREPEFVVVSGTPGELAVKLRERKLDGAFLSPVDAVKQPGTLRPAGTAALVSRPGAGTARLLFREGLRSVESIAVDPGRTSEIVLTHLVLVEKYGSAPKFVPRKAGVPGIPPSVDALLLAGDETRSVGPSDPWIDIVSDWVDIAGVPFVHGLWYAAGDAFGGKDAHLFESPEVVEDGAAGSEPGTITYRLGDEERAALTEFLTMAYFHGILKEIPEPGSYLPDAAGAPRSTG